MFYSRLRFDFSLLVGRVPSTLILSFVFREHYYLIVSLDLVTTVSGNVFLCAEIYFYLPLLLRKG